ncbi:hypothetical protein YC2023_117314 [Brassica napus]
MPTTLSQSRSHRRSPEESMIHESLQFATMEMSMKLNIQNRSRLTQQHRSTVVTRNRPTYHMTNQSIVVQMIGRMTTTTPLLTLTQEKICIQTSIMKTLRRNEPLSTKPSSTEQSVMRKINSHIIRLGKGMHHRSIDMTSFPLIDTQPKQRCRERASTDTAYYKSVDTDFNRVREGDYSIGSWADEHHHESFAVDTVTYTTGEDKLQDSFIDEELLNMQKRDDTDQFQAEAAWERTRSSQSIDTRHPKLIDKLPQQSIDINNTMSIDINNTMSIDNHPIQKTTVSEKDKLDNQYLTPDEFGIFRDPNGYAKAIEGRTLHLSREDIADILQTADGADNLFIHQGSNREQKTTKESYDTAGGIENSFKQRSRHTTHPSTNMDVPTVARQPEFGKRAYDLYGNRKFYWEEKDEYGVYRDDS